MMKRILVILFALLSSVSWAAGDRASEIVSRLAAKFRAMESYGAVFEIEAGDRTLNGNYVVHEGRYYMSVGTAEAYADGKTRYEVDNERREVVISDVLPDSHVVLENPLRAFDYIDKDYRPELVSESGGEIVVRLCPSEGPHSMQWMEVTLTLDRELNPLGIVYEADGDRISIRLLEIVAGSTGFKTYAAKNYKGYEIIDLR